jgi:hypothetical protein
MGNHNRERNDHKNDWDQEQDGPDQDLMFDNMHEMLGNKARSNRPDDDVHLESNKQGKQAGNKEKLELHFLVYKIINSSFHLKPYLIYACFHG